MKLIPLDRIKKNLNYTDAELVALYKETLQTKYVGELYQKYHHLVYGVALKYLRDTTLAEDALLEIFSHLFEQLIKYKIDDFSHWLLTVTRNHCLRQLKISKQWIPFEKTHEKNSSVEFVEFTPDLDLWNEKEIKLLQLDEALKLLKPEQFTCVKMFYLDDCSYQHISETTGFDIKKVKSYIQNGKRNLQLIMEQQSKKNKLKPL